jgi:hypothetical protein
VGRIIFAIIPFVVAGALIIASLHLFVFTTDTEYLGSTGGEDTILIHPNQTYTYNVTISYVKSPNGTLLENGSIVITESIIHDTFTSWTRIWLPISILLNHKFNGYVRINQTLKLPNGVVKEAPGYVELGGRRDRL